jgi:hypothetical protein
VAGGQVDPVGQQGEVLRLLIVVAIAQGGPLLGAGQVAAGVAEMGLDAGALVGPGLAGQRAHLVGLGQDVAAGGARLGHAVLGDAEDAGLDVDLKIVALVESLLAADSDDGIGDAIQRELDARSIGRYLYVDSIFYC